MIITKLIVPVSICFSLLISCSDSAGISDEVDVIEEKLETSEDNNSTGETASDKGDGLVEEMNDGSDLEPKSTNLMRTENFGGVSIDMDSSAISKILGKPTSKTPEEFWGADGAYHSEWIYTKLGITVGMSRVTDHPDKKYCQKHVDRMTIYSPSAFTTAKKIGIWASLNDVRKAYDNEIGDNKFDNNHLIAGTPYGGLIFYFKNGKVVEIFLGAGAE
jgi:hypothetical protein